MVLFFTHILFVVNHTINATPPERLQQYHSKGQNVKVGSVPILLIQEKPIAKFATMQS